MEGQYAFKDNKLHDPALDDEVLALIIVRHILTKQKIFNFDKNNFKNTEYCLIFLKFYGKL